MLAEIRIVTANLSATYKLGEAIAKNLKGNETFALIAPLGGGKTSFTQGLAKGLNAKGRVLSPTFVLERIYDIPKQKYSLYHFDMYRIGADEAESTGLLDILGEGIVVIEWAEKIKKYLPQDTIWVEIKYPSGRSPSGTGGKWENSREFIFNFPESRSYIFKDIPRRSSG